MLLVLVKGLVLVSGSHGECRLPLAGMLLILILLCELPRDAMLFGLPKPGKARRALAFKPTRHHASDLFAVKSFLAAVLRPRRGANQRVSPLLPAAIKWSCPRRSPPRRRACSGKLLGLQAATHSSAAGDVRGSARGQRPFLQRQSFTTAPATPPATQPWAPTNQDSS